MYFNTLWVSSAALYTCLCGFQTIQLSTIKFEKIIQKDVKRFKLKLGEFLSHHSFYTLDEYIEYSSWKD
jgi:hypothetical protein